MSPIELVVPVFSLIAVSWVPSRIGLAGETWIPSLNDYAYYVAFPALVLASLTERPLSGLGGMIAVNAVYLVISMVLALPAAKGLRLDSALAAG